MSYDETQQQQHELVAQTRISPALSSVFGSSSLGTLGSSTAFSPNAFTPPVGPLCIGEGATGLPMSAAPLMHVQQQQQHSPLTFEQMQLLAAARMQQQQQAAMSAAGFGAIGAERARRDSHTSFSGVSGSGASFSLLASAAAVAGLDNSFTQLLKLDPTAACLCQGAGMPTADEQYCLSAQSDLRSCFAPAVGDALPMPASAGSCCGPCIGMHTHSGAALPNGLGLSEASALRIASNHWPGGEPCASDPRAPSGQHF